MDNVFHVNPIQEPLNDEKIYEKHHEKSYEMPYDEHYKEHCEEHCEEHYEKTYEKSCEKHCRVPRLEMQYAQAYVPFQEMREIYDPEMSLRRGTVFPELDLPYKGC